MKVFAFIAGVQLQGLVFGALFAPRVGGAFCGWASWPLGLLLFVLTSGLATLGPLPSTAGALLCTWIVLGAAGIALLWRRRGELSPAVWLPMLGVGGLFLVAAAVLCSFDLAVLTVDSHVLLREGRAMIYFDEPPHSGELSNRGVFMMLAQGVSVWLDAGYLPELAPLLALSLVGAFVHLGARALAAGRHDRRRAMGVAVLTAAALMSPYLMLLHAFYIHVNLAAAVYLFLAVACLWSAEREAEKAWLTLGFVFLAGFALQRVEAIGLVLALIAMAWSRTRLDDHAWRPRLIVGWLCALVWHVEVWQLSGPAARILTPDRLMVLMAGIAAWAGALVLLARPALARWRPRLAPAMLTGLGLATLAAAAANPRGVWASLGSLIENSVGLEWGGLWPVMTLLALASLPLLGRPRVPPPGQWLFAAAAFGQVAFVIMLSALRNLPYTPFWQDSGNRMLIHATPLLLFWLMLVYGPVVVSSGRADGYTARAAPSPVGARESPSFGALRDTRSR